MKRHSLLVVLLLVLLAPLMPARAERLYDDYFFKFVTKSDGLAASQVNAICKDSHGYMWFGTSNGLSRFDGYHIINFYSDYTSNSALPDGYIESIQEDKDGMLWIGTSSGYVVFDPVRETFDRSVQQRLMKISGNEPPSLIYIDGKKNMWIVVENKGLYFYKTNMDLVYTFMQSGHTPDIPVSPITGICDSPAGVNIVHENGAVCCINSESRQVEWVNDVLAKKNIEHEQFGIASDIIGNIILYCPNSTYIYEADTRNWHTSLASFASAWGCDWQLGDAVITDVCEDQNHFIWVSTDRAGILLLDVEGRKFRRHLVHTSDIRSVPTNNIQTLYVDDSNLLWVGTMRFGVAYWGFNIYRFLLDHIGDVNGIDEDPSGNLWIATRNRGLMRLSKQDSTYTVFDRRQGLSDDDFSCVLAARDGSVWCGSNRYGLCHLMGSSVVTYRRSSGVNSLASDNIQTLAEDMNGNIWIGTNGSGLQCLNVSRGSFANFNVANGRLPSDVVNDLYIKGNKLAVATANGLAIVNLSSNKSEFFQGTRSGNKQFSNPYITQCFIDSRDLIWVGTRDGLNLLDTRNDIVQAFGYTEGIPNNMICGLEEDKLKHIWVTTAGGVCRLVPQPAQTGSTEYSVYVYNYTVADGLQRAEFNTGSITSTRDGRIYMGGANGLNWINIGSTMSYHKDIKVMFTGFTFHDGLIRVGHRVFDKVMLTKDINFIQTLTIDPRINMFAIQMSVNNYYRCDHPQFIYMLEGRDSQWHPGDPLMHGVRFRELPPGRYVLHVKAIVDDGKTTEQEHVLEIIVESPWWMRWWAIALYVVAFVVMVLFFRWFVPRWHRQFVESRQERELYRKRAEALRSITDKLITPVAKMSTDLQQLYPMLNTPDQREVADDMLQIGQKLMSDLKETKNEDIESLLPDELRRKPVTAVADDDTESVLAVGEPVTDADYALATKSRQALRTVYLVDADNEIAEYIADSLKNAFDFKIFNTGEAAWSAVGEHRPDLMLVCEQLPDMRGSELCIRMKQEKSFARIPFVLMLETAMSVAEIEKNNITFAADDYVLHFYDLISLRMRCSSLLGEIADDMQMPVEEAMTTANAMTESVGELIKRKVHDYVLQNISNPKLPLDDLCLAIGVPLPQLFRKLEQLTGCTPTEYIRDIRLAEAANLLRTGTLQPVDVYQEVGFLNMPTFSRFFQEKYGMLPNEFCEQYKS